MRIIEGGMILHGRRIEHHHIGIKTFQQQPALAQLQIRRRQAAQFANGFRQRNNLLGAYVLANHPGEITVSPRVRALLEKDTLGCK